MRQIGKYVVTRKLGAGGMGVVFAARDPVLDRPVAIKLLHPDSAAADPRRFEQEARTAARVNHPNTVTVHDVGEHDGRPFIVMELVAGLDAGELVGRRGPLPWRYVARVLIAACKGLAAIHTAGLVHRDIKPTNLLISKTGTVKVVDFGLAKPINQTTRSLTGSGTVGTPHYMSPEQCQGDPADPRSDVYALGATFFTLITGRAPYDGDTGLAIMYAHCNGPIPDPRAVNPEIPDGCARVVGRAMAKRAADRYQTAAEMRTAFEELLATDGAATDPTADHHPLPLPPPTEIAAETVAVAPPRDPRLTRRVVLLGVGAAVAGGGYLVYHRWWSGNNGGGTPTGGSPDPREPGAEVPPWPPLLNVGGRVGGLALPADGQWVAVGLSGGNTDGGVKLYRRGSTEPEAWLFRGAGCHGVAVSPDGNIVAAAETNGKKLLVWDRAAGRDVTGEWAMGKADGGGWSAAFSPNGQRFAAAVDTWGNKANPPYVRVLRTADRTPLGADIPTGVVAARRLSFSPNGQFLAVSIGKPNTGKPGGEVPRVEVWAAADRLARVKAIPTPQTEVGPTAAFAAGAAVLAVSGRDATGGRVDVYDAPNFDTPRATIRIPGEPLAMALSPNGSVVAVSLTEKIQFYNVTTGKERARRRPHNDQIFWLTFTPDGRTVVSGDGSHHQVRFTPVPAE